MPPRPSQFSTNITQSLDVKHGKAPVPYTNTRMLIPANSEYERIPDSKLERFLSHKTNGDSDAKAASLVKIDLRAIKYWLREDQRFADAYADAMVHAIDNNEDRVMELCRNGSVSALKMWLEAMRPERWSRINTQFVADKIGVVNTINMINLEDEKEQIINDMPDIVIENVDKGSNDA